VVTHEAVREAVARLEGVVHKTPLFHSRLLDEVAGGTILLKAENIQRSGAFKFRGAYNAIAKNLAECRKAGVTTGSSGNHGGAVALAAPSS
jgi:threonine dehydratase